MSKKKIIIGAILILVLAAGAVWWFQRGGGDEPAPTLTGQTPERDPNDDGFILGLVTEPATPSHVFFSANGTSYAARIGFNTRLIKQVTQEDGSIVLEPADLTDFQPGVLVSAHYDGPRPADAAFDATRVQIMGQGENTGE